MATTSTKPPPVIKADIRRVLERMQVRYRETKGGFECIHLPSIDLSSVEAPRQHTQYPSSDTSTLHRPSIARKASKLSFGVKREKGKDRDNREPSAAEKDPSGRPSGATALTATPSSGSSSFFNVSSNHTVIPETNGASSPVEESPPRSYSPSTPSMKSKVLPPIPRDFGAASPVPHQPSPLPTGEVDRDLFESMGNNTLSVRFEISIVKVSLRIYF